MRQTPQASSGRPESHPHIPHLTSWPGGGHARCEPAFHAGKVLTQCQGAEDPERRPHRSIRHKMVQRADPGGCHQHHPRRFYGAAPIKARKRNQVHWGNQYQNCFNGAAPIKARKQTDRQLCRTRRLRASMGPHQLRRGNQCRHGGARGDVNASMGPHQLRRGNYWMAQSICMRNNSGFNGAAPIKARKQDYRTEYVERAEGLQWGRTN